MAEPNSSYPITIGFLQRRLAEVQDDIENRNNQITQHVSMLKVMNEAQSRAINHRDELTAVLSVLGGKAGRP